MQKPPPHELSTPRLLLRAACAAHAASLFMEYTGDSHASRFLPRGPHLSQSRTEAVIAMWGESSWTVSDRFIWSIIDRTSDKPMGLFLLFMEGRDNAEIHYGLGPAFWGKGLATEAGLAVMDWMRKQSHLSKIHTTCVADHDASGRVLEKMGFSREQFIPGALLMKATGERMDGWSYVWKRTD